MGSFRDWLKRLFGQPSWPSGIGAAFAHLSVVLLASGRLFGNLAIGSVERLIDEWIWFQYDRLVV
jgi:hypothetical protein